MGLFQAPEHPTCQSKPFGSHRSVPGVLCDDVHITGDCVCFIVACGIWSVYLVNELLESIHALVVSDHAAMIVSMDDVLHRLICARIVWTADALIPDWPIAIASTASAIQRSVPPCLAPLTLVSDDSQVSASFAFTILIGLGSALARLLSSFDHPLVLALIHANRPMRTATWTLTTRLARCVVERRQVHCPDHDRKVSVLIGHVIRTLFNPVKQLLNGGGRGPCRLGAVACVVRGD